MPLQQCQDTVNQPILVKIGIKNKTSHKLTMASFSNKDDQAKKQDLCSGTLPRCPYSVRTTCFFARTSYGGKETSSIQDQLGAKQLGKKKPCIHVTSKQWHFFQILKPPHNLCSSAYFSWHRGFSNITLMYIQLSKKFFREARHARYKRY